MNSFNHQSNAAQLILLRTNRLDLTFVVVIIIITSLASKMKFDSNTLNNTNND